MFVLLQHGNGVILSDIIDILKICFLFSRDCNCQFNCQLNGKKKLISPQIPAGQNTLLVIPFYLGYCAHFLSDY